MEMLTEPMTGNVTFGHPPFTSLYILDFVDNNGSRIEERTGLVVFDGQGLDPTRLETEPEGVAHQNLILRYFPASRAYETCLREIQQLLKTITFPSQITTIVQCI